MDNAHNKSELIHLLSSTFHNHQITVVQCDNDAGTSIMRAALSDATDNSIEVRIYFYQFACMAIYDFNFTGVSRRCRFADNVDPSLL